MLGTDDVFVCFTVFCEFRSFETETSSLFSVVVSFTVGLIEIHVARVYPVNKSQRVAAVLVFVRQGITAATSTPPQ